MRSAQNCITTGTQNTSRIKSHWSEPGGVCAIHTRLLPQEMGISPVGDRRKGGQLAWGAAGPGGAGGRAPQANFPGQPRAPTSLALVPALAPIAAAKARVLPCLIGIGPGPGRPN